MKSKLRKPLWFYSDLYMLNFYFMPGYTQKEVELAIKKNAGLTVEVDLYRHGGKCITANGDVYLWVENMTKVWTLAHECLHATNFILHTKGVGVSTDNDEAQCYLMEWIIKQCVFVEERK